MADAELVPAAPAPSTSTPATTKTTAIDRVPVQVGIAPTTIDEAWRLATIVTKSNLVPQTFKNKPEDALIAIMMGAELGLSPMLALQSIAVINGRPSVWGDGLLALIRQSPLCLAHEEYFAVGGKRVEFSAELLKDDTTAAVCVFQRRGNPESIVRSFSIAQARLAHLWGKAGPWQEYPDRMLRMRARSFAARDAFPDVLRGLSAAEESNDLPPIVETTSIPGARVRRLSERPDDVEVVPSVDEGQADGHR